MTTSNGIEVNNCTIVANMANITTYIDRYVDGFAAIARRLACLKKYELQPLERQRLKAPELQRRHNKKCKKKRSR